MEIFAAVLIYMAISFVISLGAKKAQTVQQKTKEKEKTPVPEQSRMDGDDSMTRGFFDEFPALWDALEKQLKGHIVDALAARSSEGADSGKTKLSSVYWNIGCAYWCYSTGAGSLWKTQLEEVFFEHRYYDTIKQLDRYSGLDALVAQRMENLNTVDVQEQYRLAVKPLLDERKQKLMAAFAEMAKELKNPLPYTLKLPVDGQETALTLGFQKRYKKSKPFVGMDGYTYSFNGRTYHDIQELRKPIIEELSKNVGIAKDAFGDLVLRRYTEIPTFDSGDREWDSEEIEYLMYDGKEIHLIVMRGGYNIAYLIFFEKLLTADEWMKPLFERVGWPLDNIVWT